ncbi:MAG: IS3 family transposase, partial [Verrucomicrobiota bacterium]
MSRHETGKRYLKKSYGHLLTTKERKLEFMKKQHDKCTVKKMAKLLEVSRSNFYYFVHRTITKRAMENAEYLKKIKSIHERSRCIYGSPRIHAELKKEGMICSRRRIAKIMRENGIQAKTYKLWKKIAVAKTHQEIAPNYANQNFTVDAPNKTWVSDISYIATREGWLYLAVVLDLFSRKIVGFSMSSRMQTDLIKRALQQAIINRNPKRGLIHHSDRGSQYTSADFKRKIDQHEMILSMSGKGNCYDNAVVESFFH